LVEILTHDGKTITYKQVVNPMRTPSVVLPAGSPNMAAAKYRAVTQDGNNNKYTFI